ncbi:hypothetical protein HMPREF9439_00151 [Parasutterella excrementihominis YIT 11859]|uniref:Uncharacterized protein n=1 Tax=Parasutterella excrementihominis YIT 11859 TaxID=762966 RepID=F3QGW1_9BURK|nr:hypothetical protein HMPREF9439_00151 [Parasutterella excrementihominis YIT 11859]
MLCLKCSRNELKKRQALIMVPAVIRNENYWFSNRTKSSF